MPTLAEFIFSNAIIGSLRCARHKPTSKATAMQAGRWLVMSQTDVSVEFSASSNDVP